MSLAQLAPMRVLLPRHRPSGSVWAQLARLLPSVRDLVDRLDDLPAALDLVAAGRGVLAAPSLLVETVRRPDIAFVPLDPADRETLRATYGVVWRQEAATADTVAVVRAVQEVLR